MTETRDILVEEAIGKIVNEDAEAIQILKDYDAGEGIPENSQILTAKCCCGSDMKNAAILGEGRAWECPACGSSTQISDGPIDVKEIFGPDKLVIDLEDVDV